MSQPSIIPIKCSKSRPCGVMVVEDEKIVIDTLKSFAPQFLEAGLECHFVTSVEEAQELLKFRKFEAALVDLNLVKTKGVDTIKKMRPLLDCPMFGYTGGFDESLRDVAVSNGADDLLIKNEIKIIDLIRLLRWAANQHRTCTFFREKAEEAEKQLRILSDVINKEDIENSDTVARLDPIIAGLHNMAATTGR
jgi:DNA-binding response OmpR family regulator